MRRANVIENMERADSWKKAEEVLDYVEAHKDEMGILEYENLREALLEIMQERFSPKDCSQLENIAIKYVSPIYESEFRNLGMHKAQSFCSTAQLFHEPLWDYLQEVVPGFLDYRLTVRRPSHYAYEMARSLFPSMEERRALHREDKALREDRERIEEFAEEVEEPRREEVRLEIDRDILEKQKRDMEQELENEIKRLKQSLEQKETEYERRKRELEEQERELRRNANLIQRDVLMSAAEYDLLRKIPHVHIQFMTREGKNLIVRIFAETEAQIEQLVNRVTEEAEQKRQAKMARAKALEEPYAPLALEKVEKILCDKYHSRFPNYACPKAMQGLAKRIAKYLYAHHLTYDSPGIGLDTIDIFLASNPTYTFSAERANDVFNAWVRDRTLEQLEEESSTPCDDEIKYDNLAKLLALDKLEKTEGLDEIEQYRRTELLKELEDCGFSYDAMANWLLQADIFFKSFGSTVGDQLNLEYADYIRDRNRRRNDS